jgi:uncharacterized membrane protein
MEPNYMSENEQQDIKSTPSTFPVIRKIKPSAILNWLHAGVEDTRKGGFSSLFYGISFAAAGLLMHAVFSQYYALFAGLTTGFLLLGPFLAMGLYDLSRRMEVGEQPTLIPSLTAWRTNIMNVGLFAGVLVVVLLIWARASLVVFALYFEGGLPTFNDIVLNVLTFKQPIFTMVYFAVGGFFAAFVFAISVVAIPLMADRKTDAITAGLASIVVCVQNPLTMLLWGFCIVVLVGFGFATSFIGLILTMPIVGHATWHVYRDAVETLDSKA